MSRLIRVLRETCTKRDAEILDAHGYLWLDLGMLSYPPPIPEDPMHLCRSLATGQNAYWYESQFEEAGYA